MLLVIDAGNTRVKMALFKGDRLMRMARAGAGDRAAVALMAGSHAVEAIVLGSVGARDPELVEQLSAIAPVDAITGESAAPLANGYATRATLGADRLANAVAAAAFFPGRAALAIDAGTCITYDAVDEQGTYIGGAISPGLRMRARAMHEYSERLPLIATEGAVNEPFGTTTEESLRAGTLWGTQEEAAGFVRAFRQRYPHGGVVLTGGDGLWAANALKSGIFAHPYLTLEGYRLIHLHHRAIDARNQR
ncbi:MAG: type III pantothenate kinase [Flavobacteriales bacterium]|nr:type III pantothenate kinase [Flavobacteriales bacterium]